VLADNQKTRTHVTRTRLAITLLVSLLAHLLVLGNLNIPQVSPTVSNEDGLTVEFASVATADLAPPAEPTRTPATQPSTVQIMPASPAERAPGGSTATSTVVANSSDFGVITESAGMLNTHIPVFITAVPAVIETTPVTPPTTALTTEESALLTQFLDELANSMALTDGNTKASVELNNTLYELALRADATSNPMAHNRIVVQISRELDGQRVSTTAQLQERAFSHYAKFINRWDPDVTLSNDIVIGRFHSNSMINLELDSRARPLFAGPVSLGPPQVLSRRIRNSGMFQSSLQTGVGRISIPQQLWPETAAIPWEQAETHYFDSDTRFEFNDNGSVSWAQPSVQREGTVSAGNLPVLLIGTGTSRFEVSGTIEGSYLLYSPRQILITASLRYAGRSAAVDQQLDDYLTLISEGSIEIAAASVTGGGDMQIDGALFAKNRFSVRRFRDRAQGELAIYGSLVAGSVSATEPRFSTRVEFDERFNHTRPPAFPGTGRYDLHSWDERWTQPADDSMP
jgi:hypothetical protein